MKNEITATDNAIAWGAIKAGRAENWKAACQVAKRNRNIVDMLNDGCVRFTFTKADGTERTAWGTRNTEIILERGGKEFQPIERTAKAVVYFDLDTNEVRSFVPARLVYTEETPTT